jgi:undecaprenyl diphosphate synthase
MQCSQALHFMCLDDRKMKQVPQHIAIIMDGNGRWAKKRFLPRVAGHVKGVNALKNIVNHCDDLGVKYLTVFAFGRENWNRPQDEVSFLMRLMLKRLDKELDELHSKNAVIRFIGDRARINNALLTSILAAENKTKQNTGLNFGICLDYSGQYDIIQAINRIISERPESPITEETLNYYLLTDGMPNPDLVIRTSGESRISNFMLWQLAYSEFYFSGIYWPDFTPSELERAIEWYNDRERRFGKISEQI